MNAQTLCQKLYDHYGSDAKVAAVSGIHQTTVSRIRRGVSMPNWKTYQAMLGQFHAIEGEAA